MSKNNIIPQKLELTCIGKGDEPKLESRILIENPEPIYGDPTSENMLIHRANLLALKALEQFYLDFVVETTEAIYMVETKAADQMQQAEVLDKKKAASRYCKYASEFTSQYEGKPWKYLLIPHNEVKVSGSFGYLVGSFKTGV